MQRQPTLSNSCALAATAAEARFRIDHPETATRKSLIIAVDEQAAALVRRLAGRHWSGGHLLVFEEALPTNGFGGDGADATLRSADGAIVLLSEELEGADVAVLIATEGTRGEAASLIGDACASHKVMSAALVVARGDGVDEAVSVLRPNAMVLLVLSDENDISPILTALRV